MNLRERALQLGNTLPLMAGREKAQIAVLTDRIVTIDDFGFMKDEDSKEYVAFTVKEDPSGFYFGGQVLTDNMKELEADGYTEEIKKNGLPIKLGKKMSKAKREYTTVEFYPAN